MFEVALTCRARSFRLSRLSRTTRWLAVGLSALLLAACAAPGGHPAPDDPETATGTPGRAPQTTRELIQFVQQAAGHVQRQGTEAFEVFRAVDGPWRHREAHLFVLSPDGRALHDGSAPHLVGQEVTAFTDTDGRPFVYWQLAAADAPSGTSWAFYRWPRPHDITPTWTATFAQRVTGRDGRTYIVGAGVYELSPDGTLLRELTDRAAERLRQEPDAARRAIDDPAGPFAYRGVRLLVTDAAGEVLAGPADAAIPPEVGQWILADEPEADIRTFPPGAEGEAVRLHARRIEIEEGEVRVIIAVRMGSQWR